MTLFMGSCFKEYDFIIAGVVLKENDLIMWEVVKSIYIEVKHEKKRNMPSSSAK